jgi:chitinase
VFCFLANWSRARRAEGRFVPENLEKGLCTHVVYSYFKLDPSTDSPATMDVVTDMDHGETTTPTCN